ncbi:MAG: UMP kinase [Acholeplasmataceae bacterium]|nr:MAG: UMP kinase [Acholeplasmataceae bacterium]
MYQRVILKLSGEALKGSGIFGIHPATVKNIATAIKEVYDMGVQIGIVIGAGNLWRGKTAEEFGMDRAQADYMGMVGTIMNGLALQDALESIDVHTRVMSSLPISSVAEPYIRRRAIRHMEKGRVVVFTGGTGSPFFSTDTAAALRAADLNADIILMAKNGIEGVFDKDPRKHQDAAMYKEVSQKEVMTKKLGVMDQTAASICHENKIDILVFNMSQLGNIKKAVLKEPIGTLVRWEDEWT